MQNTFLNFAKVMKKFRNKILVTLSISLEATKYRSLKRRVLLFHPKRDFFASKVTLKNRALKILINDKLVKFFCF